MKHLRLIIAAALLPLFAVMSAAEDSQEQIAIKRIKDNIENYYTGEGTGRTESRAFAAAQEDLAQSINAKIVVDITGRNTEDSEQFDAKTKVKSSAEIKDLKRISYSTTKNGETVYTVFVYVSKADYKKQMDDRKRRRNERVASLIEEGKLQEGKLNIADALRYFNWALNMASYYKIEDRLSATDNRPVGMWLDDKIKSIIKNIDVKLAQNKVEYDPNDYDKYTVNVELTYANRPVAALDVLYFNGTENMTVGAKNGAAALKYPSLDGMSKVQLRVKYSYDSEDDLDPDLADVYDMHPRKNYDEIVKKSVDVKFSKKYDEVKEQKPTNAEPAPKIEIAQNSASIQPHIEEPYKEVDRQFINEKEKAEPYLLAAAAVEQALRGGKDDSYKAVEKYFSPEGVEQFRRMVGSGKISVSKTPTYTLETTTHYVRCGSIPVSVKNGGHSRNENIIMRFDPESKKISSITFALTHPAENDIFRDANWTLDARYSILKFMEDYQTAFAIKDIDYINSIFSGRAVIITGTKSSMGNNLHKNMMAEMPSNLGTKELNGIVYTQFTKDEYMKHLKKIFDRNSYVHLTFHDAEIRRCATAEGMYTAYWIQLKQDHNSTTYNDKGFLSLQIGMRSEGSQIYTRTWTPEKLPLDSLINNYKLK